jgi:hypothetical protein
MRRSSWITLGIAVFILAVIGFLLVQSAGSDAPPMTPAVANEIIERGKKALAEGDSNGIIDLMAPDARILEKNPDYMRTVLDTAIKDLRGRKLEIKCGQPEVKELRGVAYVSFDMDVGERGANVDIQYYHTRLDLQMKKVQIPRWFGLHQAEEWRIVRLDSSQSLDVPPL